MTSRTIIVDHVLFVVEDLDASRRLYMAALAEVGITELRVEPDCVSYGREERDQGLTSSTPLRTTLPARQMFVSPVA